MSTKAKPKKVNKAWLHDHINDPYVKLATKEAVSYTHLTLPTKA